VQIKCWPPKASTSALKGGSLSEYPLGELLPCESLGCPPFGG